MNFLDFAAELQLQVDDLLAELIDRVLFSCDHFKVVQREECVRSFVRLANSAKLLLAGKDYLSPSQLEQFREIRDLARKLKSKLDELREDELDELTHHNSSPFDFRQNFSGAIEGAAKYAGGLKTKREVIIHVAQRFVLLCHEYGIAVRWSKSLDGCSKYCSARLLGAVFEVGGLSFGGDGEQRTASDSANNCLAKLSKGFPWEFHYPNGHCEFGYVFLNRIVRESDVGLLPRFAT